MLGWKRAELLRTVCVCAHCSGSMDEDDNTATETARANALRETTTHPPSNGHLLRRHTRVQPRTVHYTRLWHSQISLLRSRLQWSNHVYIITNTLRVWCLEKRFLWSLSICSIYLSPYLTPVHRLTAISHFCTCILLKE